MASKGELGLLKLHGVVTPTSRLAKLLSLRLLSRALDLCGWLGARLKADLDVETTDSLVIAMTPEQQAAAAAPPRPGEENLHPEMRGGIYTGVCI